MGFRVWAMQRYNFGLAYNILLVLHLEYILNLNFSSCGISEEDTAYRPLLDMRVTSIP